MKAKMYFASLALGLAAMAPADALGSHFRGAALVPQVSSTGLLTVTSTSFWRETAPDVVPNPFVAGAGTMTQIGATVTDTSDARYTVQTQVFQIQLPGAGTYSVSAGSCCRVSPEAGDNWLEDSWQMDSGIVWNGSTANVPIAFNFSSVQSQVNRNGAYSDNLDATSPSGLTLTYNQNLNLNITGQPTPGFNINTTTGLMTIPAGPTEAGSVDDNTSFGGLNVGADKAFSGNIVASDGSFVEFDWMFDGVDGTTANLAPDVNDGANSGVVGTLFNFLFTITDPEGETLGSGLSFDATLFGILGPVPAIAPVFNALTGQFSWDSTGSALGQYIFQVRGRDSGNLTDVGSFTVDLLQVGPPGAVPEPAALLVHGGLATCGLLGWVVWRRRSPHA
jgi:hypothetical protein